MTNNNTKTHTLQSFYSFIEAQEMFDISFDELSPDDKELLGEAKKMYENFLQHEYTFTMPTKAINNALKVEEIYANGYEIHPDAFQVVQKLKKKMKDFSLCREFSYKYNEQDIWTIIDEGHTVNEYLHNIIMHFEMDEGAIEYMCGEHGHMNKNLIKQIELELWQEKNNDRIGLIYELSVALQMEYYKFCEETYGEGKGDYYAIDPQFTIPSSEYGDDMDFKDALTGVDLEFKCSKVEQEEEQDFDWTPFFEAYDAACQG